MKKSSKNDYYYTPDLRNVIIKIEYGFAASASLEDPETDPEIVW